MIRTIVRRLKKLFPQRSPVRLAWHHLKAFFAALLSGFPARKLVVIGVTGTDGKTTTVGMIAHILQKNGVKVGALSTAFFQIGDDRTWNATQKTSPSPFVIQRFLRRLVSVGCTHAVLEYSSHGLVQGRSAWTWPTVAAITNTSFEHLDYHGSMQQYRKDKGILFRMLGGRGTKVLNREDATYELYLPIRSSCTFAYTMHPLVSVDGLNEDAVLWAEDLRPEAFGTGAQLLRCERGAKPDVLPRLQLGIPGSFNADNALCAVACTEAVGIAPSKAIEALSSFAGIPGRMERIEGSQPFAVFVDFTVTPVAYQRTLSALRSILPAGGRLLVLTGSCGDRMREKRPEVGRVCSQLADVMCVTNEDPYTENPERIIDEVWSGIDQTKTQAHRIVDRRAAIAFLFSQAKEGDIVLLCGKGSDTTMMTASGQIPWNEREIAKELLQEIHP